MPVPLVVWQRRVRPLLVVLAGGLLLACSEPVEPPLPVLVNLRTVDDSLFIDARYATAENFFGVRFYPENELYLLPEYARRLGRVQSNLKPRGYCLKVLDAFRPLQVQRAMWERVPDGSYVADPAKGSNHSRGCAVDVTLTDREGNDLPMPTAFDEFTERAHRDYMELPAETIENRETLERAMALAGFEPFATEWWHFDGAGCEDRDLLYENPYGARRMPDGRP